MSLNYRYRLAFSFLACLLVATDLYGQDMPCFFSPDSTKFVKSICTQDQVPKDTFCIAEVYIIDNILEYLVDELVLKEERCPYFDSCVSVSVDIMGVKDSLGVVEGKYCIHLSMWSPETILYLKPMAYFKIKDRYGFIDGIKSVIDATFAELFKETGNRTCFIYDGGYVERNSMNDDSHSLYEYWLLNKKWYYGQTIRCGE